MRVTITGAGGRIGRHVTEELEVGHELRLIDRAPVDGHACVRADLSTGPPPPRQKWWRRPFRRLPRWEGAFEGSDVIVHLAANANPAAPWPVVLRDNVQATWNVLDASARHGARRVVLASSCRWVLGLEREPVVGWAALGIGSATAPRPSTAYGLSKAWAETAGRMFVDQGRLPSVVVVRIGHFRAEQPPGVEERMLWLRPSDARAVFRRCVEADVEGFHIVYAISGEATGWVDVSHTRELLGWPAEDRR